jgi:hypothetical protein
MTSFSDIKLPNGETLPNIPNSASQSDVRDYAISQGLATAEEWEQWAPELTSTSEKAMNILKSAGTAIAKNGEITGGLAGAATGALTGSLLGPVGTVAGGIIGGAFGSAGGSLASDAYNDEELDYATALDEALISTGIDVVTLGIGSKVPALKGTVKRLFKGGLSPQQAADKLIEQARAGTGVVGSPESLQATQKLLSEGGATLTPFQTGKATARQLLGEKVAQTGIFSGNLMDANHAKVSQVINDSFAELVSKSVGDLDPSALGGAIHGLIDEGKQALYASYDKGLTGITGKMAGRSAPVAPVRDTLDKFIKSFEMKDITLSSLDPQALKIVTEFKNSLGDLAVTNTKDLIAFQKTFNNRIKNLTDSASDGRNPIAARQLADLSTTLKEAIHKSLEAVDEPAALAYKKLNKSYAVSINTLLPKLNKTSMAAANRGKIEALGNVLLNEGSLDATKALMKSVDESFKLLGGKSIYFTSTKEVKDTIRAGFLKKLMPDIGAVGFDATAYKNLATRFSTPKGQARMGIIMGEQSGAVRQLFNTMAEASTKPASNIGELALRAKEYGLLASVVTTGVNIGTAVGAGIIFITPQFLAKAAVNPKAVNKILAFEKTNFKGNTKAMNTMMMNIVTDVFMELPADEQQELMDLANI